MSEVLNIIKYIVVIGTSVLFAAFFSILGLHKREIWEEIKKYITFK